MQKLILKIEDSHYGLLLQFLKTLDYVQVVQPVAHLSAFQPEDKLVQTAPSALTSSNQLSLLLRQLQQSRPLFQNIADPVAWQQQQRDEWA